MTNLWQAWQGFGAPLCWVKAGGIVPVCCKEMLQQHLCAIISDHPSLQPLISPSGVSWRLCCCSVLSLRAVGLVVCRVCSSFTPHSPNCPCPFQTDGASAMLIMSEEKALAMGYKPKAYLR